MRIHFKRNGILTKKIGCLEGKKLKTCGITRGHAMEGSCIPVHDHLPHLKMAATNSFSFPRMPVGLHRCCRCVRHLIEAGLYNWQRGIARKWRNKKVKAGGSWANPPTQKQKKKNRQRNRTIRGCDQTKLRNGQDSGRTFEFRFNDQITLCLLSDALSWIIDNIHVQRNLRFI